MRAGNSGIKVEKTGFWVHLKFPELGCSPDGLVTDNSGNQMSKDT
jgi:hypothetical protein